MIPPHDWDPHLLRRCPAGPWRGECWRGHNRRYPADSYEGSRRVSGRYHRAPDCTAAGPVWPALYLALTEATAILEVARQYDAGDWPPQNRRFTKLRVELEFVFDCSDPTLSGLSIADLWREPSDQDRDPCHEQSWAAPCRLAAAAVDFGAEAIVVPSAGRRGDNLIVFPDNLRAHSVISVTGDYFDPRWSRQQQ